MHLNSDARSVFDAMSEGILLIDTNGRIVFGNLAYRRFLQEDIKWPLDRSIEGVRLRDIRPGARLPDVLINKKTVMHAIRKEDKDIYFVNMYPLYLHKVLVGGLSVVTFLQDAEDFRTELESHERQHRQLLQRISNVRNAPYTFDSIVATAPASLATKDLARRIAQTDGTVLLESESGTGKELYAQAIHNGSARSTGVFLAINCANFTGEMLEAELFGYEDGAFTGAKKGGKMGLFEAANHGTLFLDEISEIAYPLQAKLLRALEEQKIRRVGGVQETAVDVRVIAACNANLLQYVKDGKFRSDLYYRISVFPVHIPPLRDRRQEIPELARVILAEFSQKRKLEITITQDALARLARHSWPGNVRELRNVLEFCGYLSDNGVIDANILPHILPDSEAAARANSDKSLSERVRAFERQEIEAALAVHGSTLQGKQAAAAALGISLATLYNKLSEQ
jgi:transcriptional regulator with PAS, ATPase and Fis domain